MVPRLQVARRLPRTRMRPASDLPSHRRRPSHRPCDLGHCRWGEGPVTLPISSSARAVSPLRIAAAGRDAGVPSTGVPVPYQPQRNEPSRIGAMRGFCSVHSSGVVHQDWSAFRGRAGMFTGFSQCLTTSLSTGRGLHASGLFSIFGSQPRRQAIADLPPSVHFKASISLGHHPSERLRNEIHELHGPENDN